VEGVLALKGVSFRLSGLALTKRMFTLKGKRLHASKEV